jgi:tetratricopeptide (TPR) repeat protein
MKPKAILTLRPEAPQLGRALSFTGRRDEGLARLEHAYEVISGDEPDEDLAMLAAMLSRRYWFSGDLERSAARAELALDIAETQGLSEPLSVALRAKGAVSFSRGHREESFALTKHALEIALEHDLADDASTCYFLLSDRCFRRDRYAEALAPGILALANKWEAARSSTGFWRKDLSALHEAAGTTWWRRPTSSRRSKSTRWRRARRLQSGSTHIERGELDEAVDLVALLAARRSTDVQDRSTYLAARAPCGGRGASRRRAPTAPPRSKRANPRRRFPGPGVSTRSRRRWRSGPGVHTSSLRSSTVCRRGYGRLFEAQAHRFRARIARDAAGLELAAHLFRELEIPFSLGVTLLEHAELTGSETSHAEAREIFQRLGASPWLERASAIAPQEESQISA